LYKITAYYALLNQKFS